MGRTKTEKGRVIDDTFRREAVRILASWSDDQSCC